MNVRSMIAAVCLLALAACGRNEVEETQREWLVDQHTLEKRMVNVRQRHLATQRQANAATPGLRDSLAAMLRDNDSALGRIEAMIDQRSLDRQAGINADDAERMRRGHDSARAAYAAAGATLDSVEQRTLEAARRLRRGSD